MLKTCFCLRIKIDKKLRNRLENLSSKRMNVGPKKFVKNNKCRVITKAEFAEEGTFFVNRFPSLRIFVNKKVGI